MRDKENNRRLTDAYQKTKRGIIIQMIQTQKTSSKRRNHPMPEYTRKELEEWINADTAFNILYSNWVLNNYDKNLKPSCDRINDLDHYHFGNIQVITWAENNEKGRVSKFRSVIGTDKNGGTVEFASIKEAQLVLNIKGISSNLIGKSPSAGGYKWIYKENKNV